MNLSFHFNLSLFSWPVRYSNGKSSEYRTNLFIQHFCGVCLFTVTVC